MLSNKDSMILEFVEQYGGITINQCNKLFYNTKYGNDTARRRLKTLAEKGYLYYDSDFVTNQRIYYSKRKPSSHSIILMNFYSELVIRGAEILEFQREPKYTGARADGFVIFSYKNKGKILLLEVDLQHRTKEDKYIKLYESNYFQSKYKTFPVTLIISNNKPRREEKIPYKIEYINLKFEGVERVLW